MLGITEETWRQYPNARLHLVTTTSNNTTESRSNGGKADLKVVGTGGIEYLVIELLLKQRTRLTLNPQTVRQDQRGHPTGRHKFQLSDKI